MKQIEKKSKHEMPQFALLASISFIGFDKVNSSSFHSVMFSRAQLGNYTLWFVSIVTYGKTIVSLYVVFLLRQVHISFVLENKH